MSDTAIVLGLGTVGLVVLWALVLRQIPLARRQILVLCAYAHLVGGAASVPIVIGELALSVGTRGAPTWGQAMGGLLLWLLMSGMIAAALVSNAKRGRRWVLGGMGKGIIKSINIAQGETPGRGTTARRRPRG